MLFFKYSLSASVQPQPYEYTSLKLFNSAIGLVSLSLTSAMYNKLSFESVVIGKCSISAGLLDDLVFAEITLVVFCTVNFRGVILNLYVVEASSL